LPVYAARSARILQATRRRYPRDWLHCEPPHAALLREAAALIDSVSPELRRVHSVLHLPGPHPRLKARARLIPGEIRLVHLLDLDEARPKHVRTLPCHAEIARSAVLISRLAGRGR